MSQAEQPIVDIYDDDLLYRRLGPDHLRPDGTVNSNAFKLHGKPDPELSVDLAKLTNTGESLSRAPNETFRLGVLRAGDVRKLNLNVRHRPVEGNKAHSVIQGNNSKKCCRQLADITRVLEKIDS